jgi:hypothetical protein
LIIDLSPDKPDKEAGNKPCSLQGRADFLATDTGCSMGFAAKPDMPRWR